MKKELYGVITEGIKEMNSSEEIKILREIVEDVISKSIDYAEEKYNQIEDKLYNSILPQNIDYTLFNTVIEKKYINAYNECLYPVLYEDLVQKIDYNQIEEEYKETKCAIIETGFMESTYENILLLTESNRVFKGSLHTENKKVEIKVKVEYDKKYEEIESKMYSLFKKNMKEWKTLNMPYCKKMVKIVMIDINEDSEIIKEAISIEFDLEEYNSLYHNNFIPVWNINRYGATPARGAMPSNDRINYEYILKYGNNKKSGNIIFDVDDGLMDIITDEKEVKVISNSKELKNWEIYEFKYVDTMSDTMSFNYEVESNIKKINFIEMIKKGRIRTKAELRQIIESYESVIKYFEFIGAELCKEYKG